MPAKFFVAVVAGLLMSCVLFADETAPELNATTPPDFVERTCGDSNATLRSPADWQTAKPSTANGKLSLMISANGGNLNLVVAPGRPGETPELIAASLPDNLSKRFREFDLIKADVIKLSGQPAARIHYRAKVRGDVKLEFCQYFINKNDRDYVLTYSSKPELFNATMPTIEEVAVSIHVP